MQILCVADFVDPIIYSPNAKERFKNVDFVLSAGDLPMDYLDFIASTVNKPIYFVFGNHNLENMTSFRRRGSYDEDLLHPRNINEGEFGSTHIDGKIIRRNGLLIAGLGGSIRYNKGLNQFTNFQMWLKVLRFVPRLLINRIFRGRFLDILLTHSPPKGIGDKDDKCHTGFTSFVWFIKTFKPSYLIHGHVHLYDNRDVRIHEVMKTKVINVYSHYKLQI